MGWLFGWQTRSSLVEELTAPVSHEGRESRTLAKFFSGNDLWFVWEEVTPDGEAKRYILLAKLQRDRSGWGYKLMSEADGPYTFSCPLSFLEMVPLVDGKPVSKYSGEWREQVKDYWKQRRELRRMNRG